MAAWAGCGPHRPHGCVGGGDRNGGARTASGATSGNLDDRYGRVQRWTSQFAVPSWQAQIGDPTIADQHSSTGWSKSLSHEIMASRWRTEEEGSGQQSAGGR